VLLQPSPQQADGLLLIKDGHDLLMEKEAACVDKEGGVAGIAVDKAITLDVDPSPTLGALNLDHRTSHRSRQRAQAPDNYTDVLCRSRD
jgi:hypothetical protein